MTKKHFPPTKQKTSKVSETVLNAKFTQMESENNNLKQIIVRQDKTIERLNDEKNNMQDIIAKLNAQLQEPTEKKIDKTSVNFINEPSSFIGEKYRFLGELRTLVDGLAYEFFATGKPSVSFSSRELRLLLMAVSMCEDQIIESYQKQYKEFHYYMEKTYPFSS